MDVIADIFDALGEATAIATALEEPVQTVHSWKSSGNIPRWWRDRIAALPAVEGKSLSPAACQYLASRDRRPKASDEQPARAA